MLVLLLTMRTWYKEGVGAAGGTDVDSAEVVPPSDKKRAEGPNLHIVAGCRGRGLGGEAAVDGVIAPSTKRLDRS